MNKRRIDDLIPQAYTALETVKIAEKGKIDSSWRGQISSFGASVATGSLLAAVVFFSAKSEKTKVDDRKKLMDAIAKLIGEEDIYEYVKTADKRTAKENIMNAAVALKLAMNLYDLGKGEKNAEPS